MSEAGMISSLVSVNWYLVVFVAVLTFLKLSNISYLKVGVLRDLLRRHAMYRRLPGPKGFPFLGSALEINKARPYETFHEWAKKFGSIYLVKIFGKKILVLSSSEVRVLSFLSPLHERGVRT